MQRRRNFLSTLKERLEGNIPLGNCPKLGKKVVGVTDETREFVSAAGQSSGLEEEILKKESEQQKQRTRGTLIRTDQSTAPLRQL
ncbi:hypothetical protein R1flu_005050 [Riccia fluitans]|uniref:Uncharacterized protein n=1 Tax=Riccia fluitans TaxID=41844 RepID=A0ABD1YS20_9MARC